MNRTLGIRETTTKDLTFVSLRSWKEKKKKKGAGKATYKAMRLRLLSDCLSSKFDARRKLSNAFKVLWENDVEPQAL